MLRGNHEEMLLQALASEPAFHQWLTLGGDATYRAYCPPTRHMRWDLLCVRCRQRSAPFWRGCRTGIATAMPAAMHCSGAGRDEAGRWALADQQAALWSRDPAFFRTYDGPLLVVGHTPTKKLRSLLGEAEAGRPTASLEREPLIAIDCGVNVGGPLCAVELPARRFYYEFP